MTFSYSAYGLRIQVPFACPQLSGASPAGRPDVVVGYGHVPVHLAAPRVVDGGYEAEPGRLLLRGRPRSGFFLAESGDRVTVAPDPDAEDGALAFHLVDQVLAAILRQRGYLVLHASAASLDGEAVAVAGDSGAGKSTTLAGMLQRGYRMLTDDVTALRLDAQGRVAVYPGVPQVHLCEDAAAGLGRDIAAAPRQMWKRMKAAVPTHAEMADGDAVLRAIRIIGTHAGEGVVAAHVSGAEKFAAILDCVYGPMLPEEHPGQFELVSALARQVEVSRVSRPGGVWAASAVVDRVVA